MYKVDPSRTDLALEFKSKPYGRHSDALQRILNLFRSDPLPGNYCLVCTKPHLAILLPVALLAGRQWQAIAAALATGLVLIAASTLWIGPQAWLDWFQAIPGQADSAANWIRTTTNKSWRSAVRLFRRTIEARFPHV